jgi:hypothetical protein
MRQVPTSEAGSGPKVLAAEGIEWINLRCLASTIQDHVNNSRHD